MPKKLYSQLPSYTHLDLSNCSDVQTCEQNQTDIGWWIRKNMASMTSIVALKYAEHLQNCDIPPP